MEIIIKSSAIALAAAVISLIQLVVKEKKNTLAAFKQTKLSLTFLLLTALVSALAINALVIALDGIDYDVFDELDVAYRCTCSRERIAGALHSIGQKELDEMLDAQEAEGKPRELEVLCQFCDNRYTFSESEIADFFKKT